MKNFFKVLRLKVLIFFIKRNLQYLEDDIFLGVISYKLYESEVKRMEDKLTKYKTQLFFLTYKEEKKKIVKNGCNGKCCEKFTLPVSIEDIHAMKAERVRLKKLNKLPDELTDEEQPVKIKCFNGHERWPLPEDEADKLIEMLIPLGYTTIDPQSLKSFNYWWNLNGSDNVKNKDGTWNKEKLNNHFDIDENQQIGANIFTCKHFDTKNRICTNYENRPELCRSFGNSCHYKGCNFSNLQKLMMNLK